MIAAELPKSVDAEAKVIGSMLLDPGRIGDITLAPADFTDPLHRTAFATIIDLHHAGEPIEAVVVSHKLNRCEAFVQVNVRPPAYLAEVGQSVSTTAHISYYAGLIAEASRKRKLYEITSTAAEHSLNGKSSTEVLSDLWSDIDDLRRQTEVEVWNSYPLSEFAFQDHRVDFLVDGCITAGQPGAISARSKSLKTTISADAALSMATATPFLGQYNVSEAINVGMISAESGAATLQETFRRIARQRHLSLRDIANLHVSTKMPLLTTPEGRDILESFIDDCELGCLFVDPTYKALPGVDDTQLAKMAEHLFPISDIIDRTGCSIIMVHHNRKTPAQQGNHYAEPTMDDINGTGYQQWARFFLLLNRRREWNPETGQHWLWFRAEGSAGFGCRKWLNATEGRRGDSGGRVWEVELVDPIEGDQAEREDAQAEKEAQQMERDRKAVCEVLAAHPHGLTQSATWKKAKVSNRRWPLVMKAMLDEGDIEECQVKISNQKTLRPGIKLAPTQSE